MSFVWKTSLAVLGGVALAVGFCAVNLRCSGKPSEGTAVARVVNELEAGKRESRNLQVEELARLARDLRILARRYRDQGEKKKAQRAIGAAQELDKKILKLRENR